MRGIYRFVAAPTVALLPALAAVAAPQGASATEARALADAATKAAQKGDFPAALDGYAKAAALYRTLGDRGSEATTLARLGSIHEALGQNPKALEAYLKALDAFRALGHKLGEAVLLAQIGSVYDSLGDAGQSLERYLQSLAAFRALGNQKGEATALTGAGSAYGVLGQPQKALEHHLSALKILRALGDRESEAGVLNNIGLVHEAVGEPRKALEVYLQALPIHRAVGNREFEANTLTNLGNVYGNTGDPRKALESHRQALDLYRTLGNRNGEATAGGNLGKILTDIGEPLKALEAYQRSLSLHREAGDRRGEALVLNNLGIVYSDTGQPRKAREVFGQALAIQGAIGDRVGEASTLVSMGMATKDLGDPRKALEWYRRALTALRVVGDRHGEARALTNQGVALLIVDQPREALASHTQALALFQAVGDQIGEAGALNNVGSVHRRLGQWREAADAHRRAVDVARAVDDRGSEAFALRALSFAERKLGRMADAEAHLAGAVALLETYRANLGGLSEAKSSFLGWWIDTYYDHLGLLLARGKTAAAFEAAQKTKARSLLDLMASGRVDLSGGLTPEERRQEQELRQRANFLGAQMIKEGVENEVGAKKRFAALKAELRETEGRLQTLTDTLYARYPGLAQKRAARTATLADLAKLLPADTALLDYVFVSRDEVRLFVVTTARGKPLLRTYPIRAPRLRSQAIAFHAACADPRKDYREAAAALYRQLLHPAQAQLSGTKRLVVCPDGVLWDIPFQALWDRGQFVAQRHEVVYAYSATGVQAALTARAGRGKPGGTLLALANPDFGSSKRFGDIGDLPGQRPIDSPSRPIDSPSRPIDSPSRPIDSPSRPIDSPSRPIDSPSRPIDSPSRPIDSPSRPIDSPSRPIDSPSRAFDSPSRAFDSVSRAGRIVPLPGTQREADALRKLFPTASILTGAKAQERAAKQRIERYRYLHFATHGFFNDASPMLSSLLLAQPAPGGREDGFLTAREIFDMRLSAEMAVLSACNTARGVQRTGDGVIGLTWALFVAGCPTQIVSQWAVDDASTATLMQRFYGNLEGKRMGKGVALRQATLSLMADPKRRHPYYWAPFVLVGDWR